MALGPVHKAGRAGLPGCHRAPAPWPGCGSDQGLPGPGCGIAGGQQSIDI